MIPQPPDLIYFFTTPAPLQQYKETTGTWSKMTWLTPDIPHIEVETYRKSLAEMRLSSARVDLEILIGLEVWVAANTVAQFLPGGHLTRSAPQSSSSRENKWEVMEVVEVLEVVEVMEVVD